MRRLLIALAMLLPASAMASEPGAPSKGMLSSGGIVYKEQRTIRDPKSTSSPAHMNRCYDNAELARALSENPDYVVTDTRTTGTRSFKTYASSRALMMTYIEAMYDAVETARPGSRSSLCIGLRPDVYRKTVLCSGGTWDGYPCPVTTTGTSFCTNGGGTCASGSSVHEQNPAGSFDDSWIIQVPNADWTNYITNEWGAFVTPTDGTGQLGADPGWLTTLQGLSGSTEPMIYGDGSFTNNNVSWTGYAVADVRIPAYQTWFVAEVLQMLRVTHAGCAEIQWKPGWWINIGSDRSGPANSSQATCGKTNYKQPAGGMGWEGFVRNGRCVGGSNPDVKCTNGGGECLGGGTCDSACANVKDTLFPTPYAGGEYETAANAIMASLESALDTNGHCANDSGSAPWTACTVATQASDCPGSTCSTFSSAKLHQIERPDSRDVRWWWISQGVQTNAHMGGEFTASIVSPLCSTSNGLCNSSGNPWGCCTGSGTGTCGCPDKSTCD